MPYALVPGTVLRAEEHSALWFQPQTAETLELDSQGLHVLADFVQGHKRLGLQRWLFRNYLLARAYLKRVAKIDAESIATVQQCIDQSKLCVGPLHSRTAPEVLHFSLTDACQQSCSGCFFSNQSSVSNRYMSPRIFEQIVSRAAEVKVFQIALGGGEPLMHPRLIDFVRFAHDLGVLANLTTNGGLLDLKLAQSLKDAGLGQIQFSLNGSTEAIHEQTRPNYALVFQAIENCRKVGLRWGLNVLVTRQNLGDLERVLQLAQDLGAWSVNILRPKPTEQDSDWLLTNLPGPAENKLLQSILKKWQSKSKFLLQTDTSLSFLRQGNAKDLYKAGVSGCSAGRRMISIQVDGRVSPCSFIPLYDTMDSGDFMAVWQASEHLERFRNLEEDLTGLCQSCELKSVCRGCRAIVWKQSGSFEGADVQCPKHQSISYLQS